MMGGRGRVARLIAAELLYSAYFPTDLSAASSVLLGASYFMWSLQLDHSLTHSLCPEQRIQYEVKHLEQT